MPSLARLAAICSAALMLLPGTAQAAPTRSGAARTAPAQATSAQAAHTQATHTHPAHVQAAHAQAAPAPAGHATTPGITYVALGDSYAAGYGAGHTDDACGRTSSGYPSLWTHGDHRAITLRTVACKGATTADVADHQVSALDKGVGLVSVTVGANDLDFIKALGDCADPLKISECQADNMTVDTTMTGVLPNRLDRMFAAIDKGAPHARVIVTGYPLPFAIVRRCSSVPLPPEMLTRSNEVVHQLNNTIAAAARRAHAIFVPVEAAFDGHELCTRDPWLVGVEGLTDRTVLHPTVTGQTRGYLPAFDMATGHP